MIEPIINTAPTAGSGLLNFFTAYFHRLGQLVWGGQRTFNVNFLPQMSNKSSKLGPSNSITKALYFPQGPDKYILETPEYIELVPTPINSLIITALALCPRGHDFKDSK